MPPIFIVWPVTSSRISILKPSFLWHYSFMIIWYIQYRGHVCIRALYLIRIYSLIWYLHFRSFLSMVSCHMSADFPIILVYGICLSRLFQSQSHLCLYCVPIRILVWQKYLPCYTNNGVLLLESRSWVYNGPGCDSKSLTNSQIG